jgi:hypothetical protein
MPTQDVALEAQSVSTQFGAVGQTEPSELREDMSEVLQNITDNLKRMRYYRRQYDTRRSYFYRQYISDRDPKFFPDNLTPRSNTFVPYPYSNVETVVSRVHDAYFTMEDWFECQGRSPQDAVNEDNMQEVMKYELKRGKFANAFEMFVRNLAIYGHAGIKVDWDWDFEEVMAPQQVPVPDPVTGQPAVEPSSGQPIMQTQWQRVTMPRACPKFLAIDTYDLLVDPDGHQVAHLTEMTWKQMRMDQEASMGRPEGPIYFPDGFAQLENRLSNERNPDEVIVRLAEYWDDNSNTWAILTFGEDYEAVSWKDLRASYRGATYSPYKMRFFAGAPIMLWYGKNPFGHKRSPILHTSFVKVPGEIFGLGIIETTSALSEALNKFTNMIADNWNLGINHRYAYDINVDIDHEALNQFNTPGGKVGVSGDPNKTIAPLPFFTPAAGDYQILDLYKGMIEVASGLSDFYSKGVGSPQGNKTSTGIAQVISESNFKLRMFIRNLELDVLQPLLDMVCSLIQQYLPDSIRDMIQRAPQMGVPTPIDRSPEELYGNYQFNIVASNYATNKAMRQRNLMALANILSQSPYINQFEAIRELLKAFDIRNLNSVMKSEQQVQMEQQQQQQQQLQMMMIQHELQTDQKVRVASEAAKARPGRPPTKQHEGKIPGANLSTEVRGLAQSNGANAMGLSGMGEMGA